MMITLIALALMAGEAPSLADWRRMSGEELEARFAAGTCAVPPGVTRGHVVYLADVKHSRLRSAMQSVVWKGKVFFDDGEFINRFCGFRADRSTVEIGASWLDGGACVVLEYPPSALVFANARDEIREVSPGVYMGRFYDRCPCPKFKGYFVLEARCR